MIGVKKAGLQHVEGIIKVCSDGYRDTYRETHAEEYIERVIRDFYNIERVTEEVTSTGKEWHGYHVALDGSHVVGAIGGGLTAPHIGEVFVLYLDPTRRGEGIGTLLLQALTDIQKDLGATEQWVSVSKGNQKGIPFYEARGFRLVGEQKAHGSTESEDYISLRYRREI